MSGSWSGQFNYQFGAGALPSPQQGLLVLAQSRFPQLGPNVPPPSFDMRWLASDDPTVMPVAFDFGALLDQMAGETILQAYFDGIPESNPGLAFDASTYARVTGAPFIVNGGKRVRQDIPIANLLPGLYSFNCQITTSHTQAFSASVQKILQNVLWNDNGVLTLFPDYMTFPLDPLGLDPGSLWSNGLAVSVVPGVTPYALAEPLFFNRMAGDYLLALGGGNLPTAPPLIAGQLWNNGGLVSISSAATNYDVLWNNGGALSLLPGLIDYPNSPMGLPPGALWNNSLLVSVVPGATPSPFAPPVFFTQITGRQLLQLGGANLPIEPPSLDDQLWNDGGIVAIYSVLANDGGVLELPSPGFGYPTSPVGLPAGAVWSDGLVIEVVPGSFPPSGAQPIYYGSISATQLLDMGGGSLPLSDPHRLNQLWNNGNVICVSLG
jgi:hypothetical protein